MIALVLLLAAAAADQPRAQLGDIGGSRGGVSGAAVAAAGACMEAAANGDCTMTQGTTYSGVTTDITAASAEDVRIQGGATSGSVVIRSIDNATDVEDSAGNVRGQIVTSASQASLIIRQSTGSTGGIKVDGFKAFAGSLADRSVAAEAFCAVDSITSGTETPLLCVYGDGTVAVERRQTATCADNGSIFNAHSHVARDALVAAVIIGTAPAIGLAIEGFDGAVRRTVARVLSGDPRANAVVASLTLAPTSSEILVVNADADGCEITLTKTSDAGALGSFHRMHVTSNAGGVVKVLNVADVHRGPACATTTGLGLNDAYQFGYIDDADDKYLGDYCTDNDGGT